MKLTIDLNADLGEGSPHDAELLTLVSSASIACGFHAGNPKMMRAALRAAQKNGVAVGAHPSFDDRENFGRRELSVPLDEIFSLMVYQLGDFQALAQSLGVRPRHVKTHGALYNMAARDESIAAAIVRGIIAVDSKLVLFAPPKSALARVAETKSIRVAREVFADRNYTPDGSLVPRDQPEALLHDPAKAAARVLRMLREHKVRAIDGSEIAVEAETVCVHGDTPDAVEFVRQLRSGLERSGIAVRGL